MFMNNFKSGSKIKKILFLWKSLQHSLETRSNRHLNANKTEYICIVKALNAIDKSLIIWESDKIKWDFFPAVAVPYYYMDAPHEY